MSKDGMDYKEKLNFIAQYEGDEFEFDEVEIEKEYSQTLDDFIIHGTKHKPMYGPIKKGLRDEILFYIAEFL